MITVRRPNKAFFIIRRRHHGFTLLEILLGGVLVSFVGLILFQVFANGVETYRRTQFITSNYIQMFKVFDGLDNDLLAAMRFNYTAVESTWQSFRGDQQSMRWIVRHDSGMRVVQYAKRLTGTGAHVLYRSEVPLEVELRHQLVTSQEKIIARGLVNEGFELYFGRRIQADTAGENRLEWMREWSSDVLPDAVKVMVQCLPYSQVQAPLVFERIFYLQNH